MIQMIEWIGDEREREGVGLLIPSISISMWTE